MCHIVDPLNNFHHPWGMWTLKGLAIKARVTKMLTMVEQIVVIGVSLRTQFHILLAFGHSQRQSGPSPSLDEHGSGGQWVDTFDLGQIGKCHWFVAREKKMTCQRKVLIFYFQQFCQASVHNVLADRVLGRYFDNFVYIFSKSIWKIIRISFIPSVTYIKDEVAQA